MQALVPSSFRPDADPARDTGLVAAAADAPAAAAPDQCPFHAGKGLSKGSLLRLPLHRRIVTRRATDAYGRQELHLYYGDKEISFDEPELFVFGETLAHQDQFSAGEAMHWGGPHDWRRVQGLLEQLIDEGILQHADEGSGAQAEQERLLRSAGPRESLLPPAPATQARDWHDSSAIFGELTGRPLEEGWLELVIPIFRIVHMLVDADGRQVGEANVFPKALRVEVPTRWRTCIYPGTRYLSDRPMNVSALKTMRAHWPQMMAILLQVRAAYLRRFPQAAQGWTVGHLERLATVVLALPTYMMMRSDQPVANGQLHPALSCLFRVTDGLRMTMHQMLFIPVGEPTLAADAPMSSAEILAYAERNYSFHSEHGVCAGPQAMVAEFLAVLVDGRAPEEPFGQFDAPVSQALDCLEEAIDYGLLGLQVYGAIFSTWPIMTRAYESLAAISAQWVQDHQGKSAAPVPAALAAFHARMQAHQTRVREATFLAREDWRVDREKVFADMVARCGQGLRSPRLDRPLGERLQPRERPGHAAIALRLQQRLARHFAPLDDAGQKAVHALVRVMMDFISQVQAVIEVASETQGHVNRLLGRSTPTLPFKAGDIDIHNLLQEGAERRLPFLLDEWRALFDLDIEVSAARVSLAEGGRDHAA